MMKVLNNAPVHSYSGEICLHVSIASVYSSNAIILKGGALSLMHDMQSKLV